MNSYTELIPPHAPNLFLRVRALECEINLDNLFKSLVESRLLVSLYERINRRQRKKLPLLLNQ